MNGQFASQDADLLLVVKNPLLPIEPERGTSINCEAFESVLDQFIVGGLTPLSV